MLKNTLVWLPEHIRQHLSFKQRVDDGPIHIIFSIADHFEPRWESPPYDMECRRVERWVSEYPKIARRFRDSNGNMPCHTFFYPEEEYRYEHLEKLADLCKSGFAEVEVHLHHEDDTKEGLKKKLVSFRDRLTLHGLLSYDRERRPRYGFIHGNWALNNSMPDGKCCGVNNELSVLRETGCYADFTLPSAPSDAQTGKINSIYYAKGSDDVPMSHEKGMDVSVGGRASGDLMLVQGPLTLNWRRRKWGILPRIENGEISRNNPPAKDRIDLWIKEAIHVIGRPEWVFVKAYTHGAQEGNAEMLLGGGLERLYSYLDSRYNDGKEYKLHYVTAREIYNIIKAAESGLDGDPGKYRDYMLEMKRERAYV